MSRKQPQNTTPIEQLIDLDDIPSSIGGNSDYDRKMAQENYERENFANGPIKSKVRNNVDFRQAMNGGYSSPPSYHLGPRAQPLQPEGSKNIEYFTAPFNCIDVSDHISSCPICSRLYSDDKTPYLIGIALLIIVVIILVKKMMEKPSS